MADDLDIPVVLGGAALTRSYVERDLREVYDGSAVLRQGRLRGAPGHGPTRRGPPHRRRRSTTGASCRPSRWCPPGSRSSSAAATTATPSRPRPLTRGGHRQPGADAAVPGVEGGQGHLHRRDRRRSSTRPPCSATSGSSGPRRTRTARPRPTRSSRTGSGPILREQLAPAKADDLLVPQVVYGHFPANGDGDDLVIWTDESRTTERTRFPFPRQRKEPWLCIADFFRPVDERRARLRQLPHRHHGRRHLRAHGRAVRGRPVPGLPAAARPGRGDGRGAGRAVARPHPRGAATSPTRTTPTSRGCSARSTTAAATRGATRPAPTSRTT